MGDYNGSIEVSAPAGQLFGYLSDVRHLPRYFAAMTKAEPAGRDKVEVEAEVNGNRREGEAWFRVDGDHQHLEWGSEGPGNYHGYLDVSGDGATSKVTVALHTERHDSGDIDRGIASTLAAVKRLVEGGPAQQEQT
jgi:hypothetical protein